MKTELIVIIAESILLLVLLITVAVLAVKLKRKNLSKADNVKIKNGVRYTIDGKEIAENGDLKITHKERDFILSRGVTYEVRKGGALIPGKYTILSAEENSTSFNLRVDGFVREFKHADDIVLNDGDTISAVSHSVILR